MKQARNGTSRGALVLSVLSSCGTAVLVLLMAFCAPSKPSDFYAYYTRLDYDDHNNTGQYADLIVNVGNKGRFVFCREFSYLPYWQPSETKYFVDRILPATGDGVAGAPVVKGGVESPALWMRFDEGLSAQDDFTRESVKGSTCAIRGDFTSRPGSLLRNFPGTGRASSIMPRTDGADIAWRWITSAGSPWRLASEGDGPD